MTRHNQHQAHANEGRVCILVNALHSKSGGGVTYLRNILPFLAADPEIDLHLCIQGFQKALIPDGLEDVTIHEVGDKIGFWHLHVREQLDVPRLAKRIKADVVFSPANYGAIFAPRQVLLIRNALSVAWLERRPAKLAYWALVYMGTYLSLAFCANAVSVSEYAKRALGPTMMKKFDTRISVIPHGVARDHFAEPHAEHHNYILAVSDIYVQKNFEAIIRALPELRDRHPGLILKVAGRAIDDEYYQSLQALIDELHLGNCVAFLGSVDQSDLRDLYRHCTVFVFPSKVETFGNPLLEAMANGAAIVSSQTAAMPEVLGDAGLYFDPDDVDDLTQKIESYLSDGDLRQAMAAKARARAEGFAMDVTAARTLDMLKSVAREKT